MRAITGKAATLLTHSRVWNKVQKSIRYISLEISTSRQKFPLANKYIIQIRPV